MYTTTLKRLRENHACSRGYMKTTTTPAYKQAMAVSLSLRRRKDASHATGVLFLCQVWKAMLTSGEVVKCSS